ncbi:MULTISPECIES: hypothetical protein [Actinomadura]|uniref:HTH cro/C1-type domain-containing protein n=1 Tax=Actinomadura yumaensis TaxID=111807 RepID=A0ABW2CWB9_9ACTN|nr:hypothetical protein [Actinomadura sp. J1-007]MWK39607.1 hypothetical protein [Actinomadura sp. J1-007]
MDEHAGEAPAPPEALLIRRHRMAAGLTVADAAAATDGRVSYRRWVQIEQGYVLKKGQRQATSGSDAALAHMAAVVGVRPGQLRELGKEEAAEVLAVILAERASREREREQRDQDKVREMADYFEDDSVPMETRRKTAERFFKMLPYFILGQKPPQELLSGEEEPPSGSDGTKRSA